MALTNCPTCKREVSTEAHTCPQCGHPLKSNDTSNSSSMTFWGVVGAIIVAILIISFC